MTFTGPYLLLYPLEAHGAGAVVQSGAEAQPIFRTYRIHHAGYVTLAERSAQRLLSLSPSQCYSSSAISQEQGAEPESEVFGKFTTVWLAVLLVPIGTPFKLEDAVLVVAALHHCAQWSSGQLLPPVVYGLLEVV